MLNIRRRMMMAAEPTDIIIDARKGGVYGDASNDAALMEVIYAQWRSNSPKYMTMRESEKVKIMPYGSFQSNLGITDFSAFNFFRVTGMADITFKNCTNLITIYFPPTLTIMEGGGGYGYSLIVVR